MRHRPPVHRRVAARIVTGPVGHLYGGLADWAELLTRWLLSELVRRVRRRWAPPGPRSAAPGA